jgi:tRNA pseudouridine55 synthase
MPHPRTILPEMPAVTADEQTVGRIRNGMQVNLPEYSGAAMVKIFEGQRDLVAVGRRVAGTLFQPFVVLA